MPGVMRDQIDVAAQPVGKVGTRKSGASAQVTGNDSLAGADKIESSVRHDPSIE